MNIFIFMNLLLASCVCVCVFVAVGQPVCSDAPVTVYDCTISHGFIFGERSARDLINDLLSAANLNDIAVALLSWRVYRTHIFHIYSNS